MKYQLLALTLSLFYFHTIFFAMDNNQAAFERLFGNNYSQGNFGLQHFRPALPKKTNGPVNSPTSDQPSFHSCQSDTDNSNHPEPQPEPKQSQKRNRKADKFRPMFSIPDHQSQSKIKLDQLTIAFRNLHLQRRSHSASLPERTPLETCLDQPKSLQQAQDHQKPPSKHSTEDDLSEWEIVSRSAQPLSDHVSKKLAEAKDDFWSTLGCKRQWTRTPPKPSQSNDWVDGEEYRTLNPSLFAKQAQRDREHPESRNNFGNRFDSNCEWDDEVTAEIPVDRETEILQQKVAAQEAIAAAQALLRRSK